MIDAKVRRNKRSTTCGRCRLRVKANEGIIHEIPTHKGKSFPRTYCLNCAQKVGRQLEVLRFAIPVVMIGSLVLYAILSLSKL